MGEVLFDLSAEYEEMLNRGIRLSGEDRQYFIAGRVKQLQQRLLPAASPRRILDFGCGTGETAGHLAETFSEAAIVGIDTSASAVAAASERYGSGRLRFVTVAEFDPDGSFDLCYVNGVFHHIEPSDRATATSLIYRALAPGGYLALFENNPWNPGTRLVMKRIPFDRDARPLTPLEAARLVRAAGFAQKPESRFLFFFPRPLAWLRFLEPWVAHVPLGAQYCVLAAKPSA